MPMTMTAFQLAGAAISDGHDTGRSRAGADAAAARRALTAGEPLFSRYFVQLIACCF